MKFLEAAAASGYHNCFPPTCRSEAPWSFSPLRDAPAHGRNVDLLDGGGRALADPTAVRQQLRLLLHLVEDLLPVDLGLRYGLLALPVAAAACVHREA